eukprot:2583015-Prymnesium_polylepis.1
MLGTIFMSARKPAIHMRAFRVVMPSSSTRMTPPRSLKLIATAESTASDSPSDRNLKTQRPPPVDLPVDSLCSRLMVRLKFSRSCRSIEMAPFLKLAATLFHGNALLESRRMMYENGSKECLRRCV